MDGTFRTAPRIAKQCYSLHGDVDGHVLPLVYCLLASKSREVYFWMLTEIKRKMADLDLQLNPDTVITDFEAAMFPTIRAHFPNAAHKGCYFHFTQAIWKQVQYQRLATRYREEADTRKTVRMLMALAFLPVLCVRPALAQLETEIPPGDDDMSNLVDYFRRTWLGLFPPSTWSVYSENVRTNNQVEGWHSRMNKKIAKAHPNFYQWLKHVREEQAATETTAHRAALGAAPPARRRKYVALDERLARLKDRFQAGDLTVFEYLSRVRHIVHHY